MKTARDVFSREELQRLTQRSNLRGWWAVLSTWAVIAGTFAVMAWWPNPFVIAAGIIVLGGRQLCLAILMHEGAHRTLFKSAWLNDVLTDWLCARPMATDVARYRAHHLKHHAHTNTSEDPDRSLSDPFPTSTSSVARKLLRDVSGISGLKRFVGQALIDFGFIQYTVANDAKWLPRQSVLWHLRTGLRNSFGFVVTNLLLAAVCHFTGGLWLYGVWLLANLTAFSLFVRIRSLAEHACTEHSDDPFRNTRTTRAGLLARITVAPIRVNFHLEHHLSAGVPYYRLPAMHRLLRERGVLSEPIGYLSVLKAVSAA